MGDIVSVCAWCPELHVLWLERKPCDNFLFEIRTDTGALVVTRVRGGVRTELFVSHGICEPCRARLFPRRQAAAESEAPARGAMAEKDKTA